MQQKKNHKMTSKEFNKINNSKSKNKEITFYILINIIHKNK